MYMLQIEFIRISCEISLRRMPQSTFDDKPKLAQEMAWCRYITVTS